MLPSGHYAALRRHSLLDTSPITSSVHHGMLVLVSSTKCAFYMSLHGSVPAAATPRQMTHKRSNQHHKTMRGDTSPIQVAPKPHHHVGHRLSLFICFFLCGHKITGAICRVALAHIGFTYISSFFLFTIFPSH